jgi:tetratricopeptide (TPR) repeat protein
VKRLSLTLLALLTPIVVESLHAQNIIGSSVMMMMSDDTTKMTIAEAKTPRQCRNAIQQEVRKYYSEPDSTKRLSYDSITVIQKGLYSQCTSKFATAELPVEELLVLSEMYAWTEQQAEGLAAAERALKAAKTDKDRALALEGAMKVATWGRKVSAESMAKAQEYAKRIDALPDDLVKFKIAAHMTLASNATDTATAIAEAERALALAKQAPASIRNDSTIVREWGRANYISPYTGLAEFYAKTGQKAKAEALFDEAEKDYPVYKQSLVWSRKSAKLYYSIGNPAHDFTATNWFNAPPGTKKLEAKGAVSLVMVTAHW